jgi:hypothetical protein
MVQESKLKLKGFKEFAAQLGASKDNRSFTPRQRVLNALASLSNEVEFRKKNVRIIWRTKALRSSAILASGRVTRRRHPD